MVGYCRVCWQEWRVQARPPRSLCPRCRSADIRYVEPSWVTARAEARAEEWAQELDDPPFPDAP